MPSYPAAALAADSISPRPLPVSRLPSPLSRHERRSRRGAPVLAPLSTPLASSRRALPPLAPSPFSRPALSELTPRNHEPSPCRPSFFAFLRAAPLAPSEPCLCSRVSGRDTFPQPPPQRKATTPLTSRKRMVRLKGKARRDRAVESETPPNRRTKRPLD